MNDTTAVAVRDETSQALAQPAPREKELIVLPPDTILPSQAELNLMFAIAKTVGVQGNSAVPANIQTPGAALAVMLRGWECGIRPMSALSGRVFVVGNRTELDTQAMMAVAQSKDKTISFTWHRRDEVAADVEMFRGGKSIVRVVWGLEDANRAGLAGKEVYVKWPVEKLGWMAIKRCLRLGAPDLLWVFDGGAASTIAGGFLTGALEPADEPQPPLINEVPASAYNPGDEPTVDDLLPVEADSPEVVDYAEAEYSEAEPPEAPPKPTPAPADTVAQEAFIAAVKRRGLKRFQLEGLLKSIGIPHTTMPEALTDDQAYELVALLEPQEAAEEDEYTPLPEQPALAV